MKLGPVLLLSSYLALSGCAGGPRGHGAPFGLLAFGAGIAIGSIFTTLPPRHTHVRGHMYYADGVFYRSSPKGYVVVEPESGLWVDDIPEKHKVIRHDDKDYFVSKGVWYRFDVKRKQYQVVDAPKLEDGEES